MNKRRWLQNEKGKYPLFYTAVFVIMAWVVFHYFWENDRTFVWVPDGVQQHYRALAYYSKWLRELFNRIFVQHNFHLPLYSFGLGYGADILTTLHYYVIGDPLNLFSVFVPESYILYLYEFLILLRIYLAGLAFSGFCFYKKKNASPNAIPAKGSFWAVLAGSFLYIFCGYALFAGVRHPYFLNPMIYLPLLLTGVERIWKEKKPGLFVGSVWLAVMSNFYFFYMLVLLVVIYVVIRLLARYGAAQWKQMLVDVLKLAGYALIGVALGAVILLPVILLFLKNSRLDTGYQFDFLYKSSYYKAFLPDIITFTAPGSWTLLGYAAIAVPAVFSLLIDAFRHPKKRGLAAGFLLLTLFLLFPAAGYAMNGFAYVANRWVWGYSMLIAFIVVNEWDGLVHAGPKKFKCVAALTVAYLLVCLILQKNISAVARRNLKLSLILLALCLAGLAAGCFWKKMDKNRFFLQAVLFLLVLVQVGAMAYFRYAKEAGNYISEFRKRSLFSKMYAADEIDAVAYASRNETGFFRYTGRGLVMNSTLGRGYYGTQFYWSLSNGNIWDFFTELELAELSSFQYQALDDRAALCALAGVKYYVEKKDGMSFVPYGFEAVELPEKYAEKYAVYENSLALAPGYTCEKYILREEYEALDAFEKQEALLQGVVLSEEVDGFEAATPVSTAQEMAFRIESPDGKISEEDGCFVVKKKGAELVLSFDGLAECETYLELNGLYYEWGEDETQAMTWTVTAEDENGQRVEKQFKHKGASYTFYNGKHDYAIQLGYSESRKVSISISFPKKGTYHIENIRVVCQPLTLYEEAVKKLGEEALVLDVADENPVAAAGWVTGEITLQKPKFLVLAVPYSDGWRAFVDQKEQKLLKANTMYCALALTEGSHQIELRYQTPGLAAGAMLSLAGLGAWIAVLVFQKRRRKNVKTWFSQHPPECGGD